ncbi:hypothetical protein GCQ56_07935 [Marinifilum sp. N1E240]|uniref:hypothetical protein n=1 Tax=Marinifilum sp. N1E240 TaxID=2608082 RepID=UPI00128E4679|nr:hypothetical protein [Marinifilum sp. N1E240]MPQ46944.1 hypothetical protein [Marinifilum sp. N1E240]
MSKLSWQAVPTMSETYYSRNSIFDKVEDICKEEMVTQATNQTWLQFTTEWNWPGPITRLIGGPMEIKPVLGIRPIPFGSIRVDIEEAFKIAHERLSETNGGDRFVGTIQMYWVNYNLSTEPCYLFTTNVHNQIRVGAYTGKVAGPALTADAEHEAHVGV